MMVFSPIDEQHYDKRATQIIYCKLFPLLMKDFLTRKDCIEMMKSNNLPVIVDVETTTGKGKGNGQTAPKYTGEEPTAGTLALQKEKQAIKDAGGR